MGGHRLVVPRRGQPTCACRHPGVWPEQVDFDPDAYLERLDGHLARHGARAPSRLTRWRLGRWRARASL